MTSFIEIKSPDALKAHDTSLLPAFDPQMIERHAPDAHWLALNPANRVTARLSLWWKQAPPHAEHRLGVIGHFAASDAEAASVLLAKSSAELSAHGCTLAVGPMDGNTWRRYRFVTERGTEPPFFLEPDNPCEWPHWFTAAGFAPLANYFSALNEDLSVEDPRIPRAIERLEREGIRLRALRPEDFVEELRRIYVISIASFQSNFLYTPIGEAEFLAQYEPIRAHIRPE